MVDGFAGYQSNTVFTDDGAELGNVVQGDLLRAEVVVNGPISYATSMGGTLTVPDLLVTKLTVIGVAAVA